MKRFLPLILLPLILTGCVHHSPFDGTDSLFFQAMGKDGEMVVTADTDRLKTTMPDLLASDGIAGEIFDRSTRVSISFYKEEYGGEEDYPADLSGFDWYGGLEGDYGSFTINTALSWSKEFHKEKEDGVKYYTDEGGTIELAVPKSGLLLFASRDYVQAYIDTFEERIIRIGNDTAGKMASSLFGIYVKSPQTMIDLGFSLPYSVIVKMSDAVIYVNESQDGYVLNADITMQSEDLASTLLQLLRQQVIAELRRQGTRPDFQALSKQYSSDGSLVMIRDFPLSEDQMESLSSNITSISGGLF